MIKINPPRWLGLIRDIWNATLVSTNQENMLINLHTQRLEKSPYLRRKVCNLVNANRIYGYRYAIRLTNSIPYPFQMTYFDGSSISRRIRRGRLHWTDYVRLIDNILLSEFKCDISSRHHFDFLLIFFFVLVQNVNALSSYPLRIVVIVFFFLSFFFKFPYRLCKRDNT